MVSVLSYNYRSHLNGISFSVFSAVFAAQEFSSLQQLHIHWINKYTIFAVKAESMHSCLPHDTLGLQGITFLN